MKRMGLLVRAAFLAGCAHQTESWQGQLPAATGEHWQVVTIGTPGRASVGKNALAVDASGGIYIAGQETHNAFKIELCNMLADYPQFAGCLTGPALGAEPSCACPDDDADGDVDLADFARFQRTFVGP